MSNRIVSYEDSNGDVYDFYRVIKEAVEELDRDEFGWLLENTRFTSQSFGDMTDEIMDAFIQDVSNLDNGYITAQKFDKRWGPVEDVLNMDMTSTSRLTKLARGYFTFPTNDEDIDNE